MISRRQMLFGVAVLPLLRPDHLIAPSPPAARLVAAAHAQIGVTTIYDGTYRKIGYPGGDIEPERGVCTDVVIRAYRAALGLDFQSLVHEDMQKNFSVYPAKWGLTGPDTSIDHRRVLNLMTFFVRKGATLAARETLQPGDLVTQMIAGELPHISIVSDRPVPGTPRPLVIHNFGNGVEYADTLTRFPVTGRFRYLPAAA
ncbi:DUF1287 domain-containing protein [Parvibaculum sp.]|uniref:DUF1287 domain-containing protein n=1 Tax=Parvibaculum sp. TaxID=2024848 RepID=UPI002731D331|nr:DUF1287 domain-containing protein [Parvibaculum sp.]MDP1627000.1 DUF1287 domain-containing protein [Parvibaculum sp.]MDP2149794.1 DUF1287 domain-containing protein [Parvibaculum sp.]MDP3327238.1 DUF1287 domain-containing protein [Parvibaculum sp.]